jgi:hypothetical protein
MLQRRQLAGALPDLNVIPINKPHCKLDCSVVIDAVKVGSACEMAVLTDEVNPVKRHGLNRRSQPGRHPLRRVGFDYDRVDVIAIDALKRALLEADPR